MVEETKMRKFKKLELYIIFVLSIMLLVTRAFANDVIGQVTIGSAAPSITDLTVYNEQENGGDPVTLTAGSTVTIRVEATITDTDGWSDMPNISNVMLYHPASSSGSEDDENTHYSSENCTFEETVPNEKLVTCFFDIGYMALPGIWAANLTIQDLSGSDFSETQNTTINELTAIELVESAVDFGVISLGANSSVPGNVTIKNMGNVLINAMLSGTDYTCSTGTIPAGNTRYSLSEGDYDSMTLTLGEEPNGQYDLNLGVRGDGTPDGVDSADLEYWAIKIPSSGVSGTCSNTISITALGGI